ncbi:MAG: putative toxin-antitoxin system toxin component, PIN family [Bacteroidaceae bacterium]|nr:putative toxin-antitoxin system toxin component, PIN family [Bacteroidaceae bacterium]
MQNIVLDTNSLVMAISADNEYYKVWQDFLDGKYNLCISNEILEEYVEVIGRNLKPLLADMISYVILNSENVVLVDPTYSFGLITADPDDNKFVDCAIVANARYIVTQDRHFNVLKDIQFPRVEVIGIDDFLQELKMQ